MMVRVGKFCYPSDFVILEICEDSDMPLIPKGSRMNAWRRRMKGALAWKMGEPEATLANQEGQLKEPKMGGYKPRPESVMDPLSVASRSKS
ncbi:unnamed protein product [Linum trigynum]|uniref:Uncharacterized protein n=1 Tax=Linum trigynum TaxID=586398 RepID=A0AAV2DBL4_9ROSI